jgi:hypothetical protein
MSFYYCKNENDIKKQLYEIITPIYFYSNDFNKTFEIKSKELLLEKDGYIYIQMLFHHIIKKWSLGTIFSLKYKFVFNQDRKQIGCYTKLKEEKIEPKNYSFILKVGVFIVLAIIILFLGIVIGRYLYKSRKKRANELSDDEYDYSLNDNVNNKCNINNDTIEI